MTGTKFELKKGRWTASKRPGDDLFYAIDFTAYLQKAGTTLLSILSTTAQGVTVSAPAAIQGLKVIVGLTDLDLSEGALNFCRFKLRCVNEEEFEAVMWFELREG